MLAGFPSAPSPTDSCACRYHLRPRSSLALPGPAWINQQKEADRKRQMSDGCRLALRVTTPFVSVEAVRQAGRETGHRLTTETVLASRDAYDLDGFRKGLSRWNVHVFM